MTAFPSAGALGDAATQGALRTALEQHLAASKELPGGAARTVLVLDADAATPTGFAHAVDTQGGAATDNLDRLLTTNHPEGRMLLLSAADPGRVVTVRHSQGGSGQVLLAHGAALELRAGVRLLLQRVGTAWEEVDRFGLDNAAISALDQAHQLRIRRSGVPGLTTLGVLRDWIRTQLEAFYFEAGDIKRSYRSAPSAGWLFADGRTIGGASSGATARANADTEALYSVLWNSTTNAELPIQNSNGTAGTRGATAAADFAANKRLPLPDHRGRLDLGRDDMGGSAANRVTNSGTGNPGIAANLLGAAGGADRHTLTIGQMPSHNHAIAPDYLGISGGGFDFSVIVGGRSWNNATASSGSSQAHPQMPPAIVCNVFIKL